MPAENGRKTESASLRASGTVGGLRLTTSQEAVCKANDGLIRVLGIAGSGKTTALAARALCARRAGRDPLIICSHQSGCEAFVAAAQTVEQAPDPAPLDVATLPEHALRWLSTGYLASKVAPSLGLGGCGAAREIVDRAARGLLDLSWPMFARSDIELDLPFLSRPETFLDEAARLIALLQRARVSPREFEEGCAAGLAAFYGEAVERARALIADPAVTSKASARGRDAMRAEPAALQAQRSAEAATAKILAQLYREYQAEAVRAALRSPEDLIDAAVTWFEADPASRDAITATIGEILVDDAEDGDAALALLLRALRRGREIPLVMAGAGSSRIDGFEGRRSALEAFPDAARIELAPLGSPATISVNRFDDDGAELDRVAGWVGELIAQGTAPGSIAVLTRSLDAAKLYTRGLRERGLPVVMPAGSLEREDEIEDLLALCAVVDDPLDQAHLLRVLCSPLVGLNDASIWTLCRDPAERAQLSLDIGPEVIASEQRARPDLLARNVHDGAADGLLSEPARAAVKTYRDSVRQWRERCTGRSPIGRFTYLATAAGFRARWDAAPPPQRVRLHDDVVRVACAVEAATLDGARDFPMIARLIEGDVAALPLARPVAGAVVVETIVGVKGLRFDHVFVVGVAHERFPRIYTSHAMAFSRTYGLIVRENVAAGAAQTAKFAWYYGRFGAKGMYLDEERRALRYALSRARLSATASGYGTPPYWARDHDLLATVEGETTTGFPKANR